MALWLRLCCAVGVSMMVAYPMGYGSAIAQDDDDDDDFDGLDDVDFGDDDDDDRPGPGSTSGPPASITVLPHSSGPIVSSANDGDPEVLVCDGGWRYSLIDTREEIGPARFARQGQLQKSIQLASAAFGFCAVAASKQFGGRLGKAKGPCAGLLTLASRVDIAAAQLFRLNDQHSCECLTRPVGAGARCEGLREQLTTLRRYDDILVQRAELVLSMKVCSSPERNTNFQMRSACEGLERILGKHYKPVIKGPIVNGKPTLFGLPGQFSLPAPVPRSVAFGVDRVRKASDGRYLDVLPENFLGVRQSLCKLPVQPVKANKCSSRTIDLPPNLIKKMMTDAKKAKIKVTKQMQESVTYYQRMAEVIWGMCNEIALADVNANTCRDADVYIDERGEIHLNRQLYTREARRNATLCIDISDFDERHPLMVTLGLDPTGSVPKRLWPGETMRIGPLIDKPVTAHDVLKINVYGKARGISLSRVLEVNGIKPSEVASKSRNACLIAKSWVPVVDHEVPIGDPHKQAVIPIKYDRGRDGETRPLKTGDYVVLWVRGIEPGGSVIVEYGKGQLLKYQPPPLLGTSTTTATGKKPPGSPESDGVRNPLDPANRLRGGTLGVAQPILPKRARYPGSRVLRLGSPRSDNVYDLRVCKPNQAFGSVDTDPDQDGDQPGVSCKGDGTDLLVDEKIFVGGNSMFGVKFHFGYSWFPIRQLEARETATAGQFEVVERSRGTAEADVAALLAIYPFGRNPRRFSYKPWSKDYWKHFALLTGFSLRTLTPWDNFLAGVSLPIANGVSVSGLVHFSRRTVPVGLRVGQIVSTNDLNSLVTTKEALAVGLHVGLSFDLDLFERAFFATWDRIAGKSKANWLQATHGQAVPAGVNRPNIDPIDDDDGFGGS